MMLRMTFIRDRPSPGVGTIAALFSARNLESPLASAAPSIQSGGIVC